MTIETSLQHDYLFATLSRIAAEPMEWNSPFAKTFLRDAAPSLLKGLARSLRAPVGDVLMEAWDVWRRPDILESRNLAARTVDAVKKNIRREHDAREALSSSGGAARRDLRNFRNDLIESASARAAARGDTVDNHHLPNVRIYGGHDDLLAAMPASTLIPGSDEHIDEFEPGRSSENEPNLRKQYLLVAIGEVRVELNSHGVNDERVNDLFDALASRLVVNARGYETELGPTHQTQLTDAARRDAVARAAETIARDRPIGGNTNDTIAHLTGISSADVKAVAQKLLGGKRTLKANDVRRLNGISHRIIPGVIQKASDVFDAR
jgi:hypothetical protein